MHHTKMLLQLIPIMRSLEEILESLPPRPHSGLFGSLLDIPHIEDLVQGTLWFPNGGWWKTFPAQICRPKHGQKSFRTKCIANFAGLFLSRGHRWCFHSGGPPISHETYFSRHYDRGNLDTNSARLGANISEKSLLSQELRGDLLRNGRRLSFP